MSRTLLFTAVTLVLTLQAASAVRQNAPKRIILNDCQLEGVEGKARCGSYEVYENRATKKGRKISLNIIVLAATGEKREPDPLVYFAGGPGEAATIDALKNRGAFAPIREHRDLLFVDQRGTGGSRPLFCEFYNSADPQSYLGYFFPLDDVSKCRLLLEDKADLTLYTTDIAIRDLDEVRAALGYEQLNLFGSSYGTRAALTYLKRYPQHVRTATLQGVAPPNLYMPSDFPQGTDRALQGVIAECATDEPCNKAFPKLKDEVKSALAQFIKGPVEVEVEHPTTRNRIKVKLSRDLFAEAIRYMLYNPGATAQIPLAIHLAAEGNFSFVARNALMYRMFLVASGSNGMYLSVTCAEDLPFIKPGEGERLAANTFLGDYRLRQQREACLLWPRAKVEPDYADPVRSDVPVLILSGNLDPVTPPSNGEAVAKTLPNSLHLVVPHGAHGFGGLENVDCIIRIITDFVERGTSKGVDSACVNTMRRKGFALKL